jgi:hypothetical protein
MLVCCGMAGCYSTSPSYPTRTSYSSAAYSAPKSVSPSNFRIKADAYSPAIDVTCDPGERGSVPAGTEIYGLYGKIDRASGRSTTFVQWGEVYTDRDWRFFSRASNDKGQSLDFDKIDRKVSSCSRGTCVYSETYNIYLSSADLRTGASQGISFKIYGRKGDERIVNLPADMVREFNSKLAEAMRQRSSRGS